jgi:hypothetical protein
MKTLFNNLLFVLTAGMLFSFSIQNHYQKLILGKWVGTKKETRNGNNKLKNGQPNKELNVFEFKPNNKVVDYTMSPSITELNYSINNDILKLGSLKFKIEKVSLDELILLDYDERDKNGYLAFRHYFKKAKRN